jgi:hypothetical protein
LKSAIEGVDMSSISAAGHHHHHGIQNSPPPIAAAISSSASSASGTLTALADALAPGSASKTSQAGQGLLKQIESAVTGALQSAPSNADPNQVVQKAIENALKNPNADSDNDDDSTDPVTAQKTFAQTLKSFGITPEQFQKDLSGAVQSVQSASGTSSFPPGTFLDTIG